MGRLHLFSDQGTLKKVMEKRRELPVFPSISPKNLTTEAVLYARPWLSLSERQTAAQDQHDVDPRNRISANGAPSGPSFRSTTDCWAISPPYPERHDQEGTSACCRHRNRRRIPQLKLPIHSSAPSIKTPPTTRET